MRRLSALVLCLCTWASQAADLAWYLPAGATHDPAVPAPRQVLGWEVGEWHLSHDQLAGYLRALAAAAPQRTRLVEIGRTHEGRPLLHLIISSPANMARLDALQAEHLASLRADGPVPTAEAPVVVWLGYSIHGDEPSGSNAAPVVAYHLAAGQGAEVERLLEQAVVILDPSFNPDGLQRFSTWANMHRGARLNADAMHREHTQGWPRGRTNHYWFDLNRDWLLTQHPESQARVAAFQAWRPHVLADFHEMFTEQTFFFQPGVPSRNNPLTPEGNLAVTRALGRHHAATFDAGGSLYFSEESFDDFYYGKGSTYPDLHGSVGILFEQASSRGHLQQSQHGELSFPFTIRNQVWASFSTLRGAVAERAALRALARDADRSAREMARRDATRAWVFGAPRDRARGLELARLLARHGVEVRRLTKAIEVRGQRFEPGAAWLVTTDQPQYRLVRTAFDRVREFGDTTFYDVSAWTLPLAFGLPYEALTRVDAGALGAVESAALPVGRLDDGAGVLAWAFAWDDHWAPRAVQRLHDAGVRVRIASEPVTLTTTAGPRALGRGAVVVTLGQQSASADAVRVALREVVARDGLEVHAVTTGLTAQGPDLGSSDMPVLQPVRPLLVVGEGVDASEAGEIWHLLDHRYGIPLSLVDMDRIGGLDLAAYTHVFMVDGRYGGLGQAGRERLKAWVQAGGVLVASKSALRVVDETGLVDLEFSDGPAKPDKDSVPERRDYAAWTGDRDRAAIAGAIFLADFDTTHPLAWGLAGRALPVFRDHATVVARPANPYATVGAYAAEPLLSGYADADNVARIAGSAALVVERSGAGVVVAFTDDPNFRSFWYGTSRLVMNALYMARFVERTGTRRSD